MNEKEFQGWEKRCIQEEPPGCTAACPVHMDVRAFAACIAQSRFQDAWQVLQKSMPFPGILGRICDAPCQSQCIRGDAGGAIRIGDLERACVSLPAPTQRIYVPPARDKRVAVAGSGLSSLTVAGDLARKGYPVTIFEADGRLGGPLLSMGLTRKVIEAETAFFAQLGVDVVFRADLDRTDFIDRTLASFDAFYLGLDALPDTGWDLEKDAGGGILVTPAVFTTSRKNVFAAGQFDSPVWQAASGRWAATSIDRFFQNISLTAGRENEGPQTTRLFVSLKNIFFEPPVSMPDASCSYTQPEAEHEAGRCLQCQCLECVKICRYLEQFRAYPKIYIRDIFANEIMTKGIRKANRLINSCSLCGLCEKVCPEHLPMQDICLSSRQSMVKRNKMPPSAHEFAIRDMRSANSEKAVIALHEPGTRKSRFLFFPGCQLGAIYPEHVVSGYAYLRRVLQGGVGLMTRCCAAPAKWAGREDLFRDSLLGLKEEWLKLGKPAFIAACPTCFQVLKEHLPGAERMMLWDVLLGETTRTVNRAALPQVLAVHDPCSVRHETAMQESVRRLVARTGCRIEELSLGRDMTECCGHGGLMSAVNPSLAKDVARTRGSRSEADYVTYCAMCRNALADSGKRVVHILDLLFSAPGTDHAARKPTGFSERRENRYRLKRRLVKEIWGKKETLMADYEKIVVYLDDDVRERMEERRILVEDIQQVIEHSEKTGARFFNPRTEFRLSSFKPDNVTYWVEYRGEGNGFRVFNAYSHRMEVMGGKKT